MESGKAVLARQRYFDKTVYNQAIRETISGKNEDYVIEVFRGIDYLEERDFQRQYPVGKKFVLDFAFVNEQVAVEVDGNNHLRKEMQKMDRKRDSFLRENNWITIRIQDKDFRTRKLSFYKSLIKDIVEERRVQYQEGRLYPIDFSNFNESDYE